MGIVENLRKKPPRKQNLPPTPPPDHPSPTRTQNACPSMTAPRTAKPGQRSGSKPPGTQSVCPFVAVPRTAKSNTKCLSLYNRAPNSKIRTATRRQASRNTKCLSLCGGAPDGETGTGTPSTKCLSLYRRRGAGNKKGMEIPPKPMRTVENRAEETEHKVSVPLSLPRTARPGPG